MFTIILIGTKNFLSAHLVRIAPFFRITLDFYCKKL